MENFFGRLDVMRSIDDDDSLNTMFYFAESIEMAKRRQSANKMFFETLKDQYI